MTSSSPLDTLIEQARQARDQAGHSLAEARRGQQNTAAQLSTLENYRNEYAGRLQDALARGMDTLTLNTYRRFLASLDQAIEQARQVLCEQQRAIDAGQDHWRQRQQRLSSFDTLATRRQQQQQHREHRQERRQTDDIASNLHQRRLPGTAT
ncbi:flagellar export protein FliJ [Alloalcanivorax xenomutans]|jgi:flagellar protein FliJ|uniref:flagellar export protein FliJ n=1 Tax=Alloalcanivorax xenomutans TaxID=1094342 RepID=UPI0003B8E870|nr:flagellar export protein FliJ [Alloalcanivorax xenomutans]ERS13432.1 flagellar export protein FliJ [Alcanivorax sp. PN-3]MBA4720355.1 flagellar export protein FliJ [Alcanivorax sp.]MCE7522646.1 flagellar export protein FliJ [Alloalcanivorax xenomutans]PHS69414.1 MAG: flagellar export protein FliJ [Alcanivorax sp.]WOD27355.1 flagellar export protein FliJ [Alloalcanivorax xenomutans]|tara:strand:+ start:992 stop:1447 length:456 start_codon:yes stop_codon:yes gene_type:complete